MLLVPKPLDYTNPLNYCERGHFEQHNSHLPTCVEEISDSQNYCKYGHYEEFNTFLPECINELALDDEEDDLYIPSNRERNLAAEKDRMIVNSAALKKQILPLLEKRAKE